jgi:hypothetical protein
MDEPGRRSPALARVLWASAAWDLLALVALWWMPDWLLSAFAHPVPAEPFLFRMAALPLLMAPVVYVLAAREAKPRSPLVTASIGLRLVGAAGIVVLLLAHRPAGSMAYWSFVGADVVWAALLLRFGR